MGQVDCRDEDGLGGQGVDDRVGYRLLERRCPVETGAGPDAGATGVTGL